MAKREMLPITEPLQRRIYTIRGQRVMLDNHLAQLYGVQTRRLRQQVGRNRDRFPQDFMFQLTTEEAEFMVSQNATPSMQNLGGYLPYVFTQEGVAMLSGVLRSKAAVQANIAIMRAFVQLREAALHHLELTRKLAELESRIGGHDTQIGQIFEALRGLIAPPVSRKPRIGFKTKRSGPPFRSF